MLDGYQNKVAQYIYDLSAFYILYQGWGLWSYFRLGQNYLPNRAKTIGPKQGIKSLSDSCEISLVSHTLSLRSFLSRTSINLLCWIYQSWFWSSCFVSPFSIFDKCSTERVRNHSILKSCWIVFTDNCPAELSLALLEYAPRPRNCHFELAKGNPCMIKRPPTILLYHKFSPCHGFINPDGRWRTTDGNRFASSLSPHDRGRARRPPRTRWTEIFMARHDQ